jgi:hypothetical protein
MRVYLNRKTVLLAVMTLVVLFMLITPALGQCSMCRTALAGANNALFIRNFNVGVLVLLLPPVTIFCFIFVALGRYKRADERTDSPDSSDAEGSP